MTIDQYSGAIKERLLRDPIVVSFHVVRERATVVDAHIRVRLTLTGGNYLDFSEYAHRTPEGRIVVATYSYHWADAEQKLICRWDNAPHYPHLPNFPFHLHIGVEETIHPSEPMDIFAVLDEIATRMGI
ncbi:MAG: DUF6516 family protein [Caldilineaceae bacterium]